MVELMDLEVGREVERRGIPVLLRIFLEGDLVEVHNSLLHHIRHLEEEVVVVGSIALHESNGPQGVPENRHNNPLLPNEDLGMP